ncbi:hypothetical protein M9H77_11842 [Catharanthus roseus]|uniref:Uncharacterized protein n=1 Tax=Catharanthus roseus TaxID=4058 RepID=A0ACC0BFT3_CATRO|nr:hypothetical protein M9H77_11842 [Catharanthus roseus]
MREFIKIFYQLKLHLYLRDMITKKEKLREASTHILVEECSTLLTKKSVLHVDRALVDLGTILDMDEEVYFFIILGRPFLHTWRVLIDMEKGKLVLRVGENEIVFKFPLLPSPSSKVQDTKGKERPKDDEKGRCLSSNVKVRLMKWVLVWQIKEVKAIKDPNDRVRGVDSLLENLFKWRMNSHN